MSESGTVLTSQVCVIGAGPVGLTLAAELGRSGVDVVVLESGGIDGDREAMIELNAGSSVGAPYQDLRTTRSRGVGGTAAQWETEIFESTWARYVRLGDLDGEARADIDRSGWPYSMGSLESYYRRAEVVAGISAPAERLDASSFRERQLDFPAGSLTSELHAYGSPERFTESLPDVLRTTPNVTLVRGATVPTLEAADGGGRVREVQWTTLSERRGRVRAHAVVLACGGIENARVLLASQRLQADHLGPDGWLGRGFMEHPVDGSLLLETRAWELCPDAGFYGPHRAGGQVVMGAVGLSEELAREERLGNASVRFTPERGKTWGSGEGWLQSDLLRRGVRAASERALRVLRSARGCRYRLLVDLEQLPRRENRVRLGKARDRFDSPLPEVDWRWTKGDEVMRRKTLDVVARELQSAGAGRVSFDTEPWFRPNTHHHMGATRMARNPRDGVVNEDLRVHGMENLFVVGTSVFPTSGYANPTLTAMALALRLADTLTEGDGSFV